jgi:phosphoribosylamine---glycine ligase
VILAAAGYPDRPRSGDVINGLATAAETGALVFHAGTSIDDDGTVRTAGGRVLAVVGRGEDVDAARAVAERAADAITWDGLQRRHDIGLDVATAGHGAVAAGAAG